MEIRKDIFGVKPEIGNLIIFNPPKHRGIVVGKCVGFVKSGLPEVEIDKIKYPFYMGQGTWNGNYTPKTGFVIYNNNQE